jgi:hypothetical protein
VQSKRVCDMFDLSDTLCCDRTNNYCEIKTAVVEKSGHLEVLQSRKRQIHLSKLYRWEDIPYFPIAVVRRSNAASKICYQIRERLSSLEPQKEANISSF